MKNLRKWRERKGLSQKEVAISLGVAAPQISKWEAGVTEPTLENLIKLSELYEITLDEIIGNAPRPGQLTSEEIQLLRIFAQLNTAGRSAVLAAAEALLRQDGMRKENGTASAV